MKKPVHEVDVMFVKSNVSVRRSSRDNGSASSCDES